MGLDDGHLELWGLLAEARGYGEPSRASAYDDDVELFHLVLDYDFPEQSILVRKLAASAGEAELDTQMGRLKLRLKGQDPVEIPLEARQEGRRV
ncbi:MAG: hypothetical protein AAFU79_34620, partial [Myxococcota bacterium]